MIIPPQQQQAQEAIVDIKPFPRQQALIDTQATECLFGGASEGGKSVAIKLATCLWCHLIPGLQIEIYRKFYNDVVNNHMSGELSYHVLLQPWKDSKHVTITENQVRWNHTGSKITLKQLRTEEDAEKAQGIAKHVLIVDEATQCRRDHIAKARGWVRMSKTMKEKLPEQLKDLYPWMTPEEIMAMFPRIIYAANPIGTSVGYFRRQFALFQPPGTIWKAERREGGFMRQYLPSKIGDNPEADPEAQKDRLSGYGEKVAKALIEGSWEAPGGDYYPEWNEDLHVVKDCVLPKHYFRFRAFDWGGNADPAFVVWCAVSDGEEFTDGHGNTRWFPRGALIIYREWNICDPDDPSKGAGMRNKDMAAGILYRTPEATSGITLADSFPFADRGMGEGKKVLKISTVFKENGVPLKKANTARKHGWSLMRDRIIGIRISETHAIPMLYVFESCSYVREYIPALTHHPVDPLDAQDKGEPTHACDVVRYCCTAVPPVKEAAKETEEELRKSAESNIMTFAGARKKAQQQKRKRKRGR